MGILSLIVFILDVIGLASVLLGKGSVGHKVLWTMLIIFFPFVGMIAYFLIGKKRSDALK